MSSNQNEKKSTLTAPEHDDRPHWCSDCRAAGRKMRNGPCSGHGRHGGGSDGGGSSDTGELVTSGSLSEFLIDSLNKAIPNESGNNEVDAQKLNEILNIQFNPALLADLMNGHLKLISIKYQPDIGKLSIKWHPEFFSPKILSNEIKHELIRFINAIEKELEAFVNKNGIQVNSFTKNIEMDNKTGMPKSLVITFANHNHYDNFVKQLEKNVFHTLNNLELKDNKNDDTKGRNKFNPFSTKLEKR